MADSDYIIADKSASAESCIDMIFDALQNIPYKWLLCLFAVFMIVSSDMFIVRVLASFEGAVNLRSPTNWGTILQGLFLVLAMLLADGLIRQGVI
jgi:hypothetical protein